MKQKPIHAIDPLYLDRVPSRYGIYPEEGNRVFRRAFHYTRRDMYRLAYRVMAYFQHELEADDWIEGLDRSYIGRFPKTQLSPFKRLLRRWILRYPSRFKRFKHSVAGFESNESESSSSEDGLKGTVFTNRIPSNRSQHTEPQRFRVRPSRTLDSRRTSPNKPRPQADSPVKNQQAGQEGPKAFFLSTPSTDHLRQNPHPTLSRFKRYQVTQQQARRISYKQRLILVLMLMYQKPAIQAYRLYILAIHHMGILPPIAPYRQRFRPKRVPLRRWVDKIYPIVPVREAHEMDVMV